MRARLVARSRPTLCDPVDCSLQAPLSLGLSRQEYWRGLPFPSPGDLPHPGIKSAPPAPPALQADSLACATWEGLYVHVYPLWFGLPYHLGHHGGRSRVPERYSRFSLVIYFIRNIGSALCFPGGSAGKESACNAGDLGWEDPLERGTAALSSALA